MNNPTFNLVLYSFSTAEEDNANITLKHSKKPPRPKLFSTELFDFYPYGIVADQIHLHSGTYVFVQPSESAPSFMTDGKIVDAGAPAPVTGYLVKPVTYAIELRDKKIIKVHLWPGYKKEDVLKRIENFVVNKTM